MVLTFVVIILISAGQEQEQDRTGGARGANTYCFDGQRQQVAGAA